MSTFLLLGCGYTGERVARRLIQRSARVYATTRDGARLAKLAELGARVSHLDVLDRDSMRKLECLVRRIGPGLRVLHSIPVVAAQPVGSTAQVLRALGSQAARVVYLSTTAVYGEARLVDEHTPATPSDEAAKLRLDVERDVAAGPWSALVLRPAAIYGPHRGLHVVSRRHAGRVRDLDRVVSRVHVDDLASITVAALLSGATGVFPVADDEPATTREVATFCERLGLPTAALHESQERPSLEPRGRLVNGRAIRRLLSIELRYSSYRTGIPAALEEEMLDERNRGP